MPKKKIYKVVGEQQTVHSLCIHEFGNAVTFTGRVVQFKLNQKSQDSLLKKIWATSSKKCLLLLFPLSLDGIRRGRTPGGFTREKELEFFILTYVLLQKRREKRDKKEGIGQNGRSWSVSIRRKKSQERNEREAKEKGNIYIYIYK